MPLHSIVIMVLIIVNYAVNAVIFQEVPTLFRAVRLVPLVAISDPMKQCLPVIVCARWNVV